MHLELDDELDLVKAHAISEEVERSVLADYPGAEVIIHLDPLSVLGEEPHQTFPEA